MAGFFRAVGQEIVILVANIVSRVVGAFRRESILAVNTTEQYKPDAKVPVSVKGMKEGLLFLLDEQCEYETLFEYLADMLHKNPSALLSGPEIQVSVDFGSRTFTRDESVQLLNVFLEKDNFMIREWGSQTSARRSMFTNRVRTPAQTIHKGTVRAGQQLFFEGDVVLIGDVNPGGEISATGDIYVFGRLRGVAHAGVSENHQAIIAAAEFAPMQLRIAGMVTRAPEVNGRYLNTFMEFAYLRDDGMAVDKMQYVSSLRASQ
jgi:septum site-determining protein MinC